jgi:hypothetical protein
MLLDRYMKYGSESLITLFIDALLESTRGRITFEKGEFVVSSCSECEIFILAPLVGYHPHVTVVTTSVQLVATPPQYLREPS